MRHQPGFKETQLFDWDTEPRLEQSSSFSFVDEVSVAEQRRTRREEMKQARRRPLALIACVGTIAFGAVALLEMRPVLRYLFG